MTTVNLSRRRAIASGAGLVALATASYPTLAAVNASPDHKLLVLGAQLDRAHADAEKAAGVFDAIHFPIQAQALELAEASDYPKHSQERGALLVALLRLLVEKAEPSYSAASDAQDRAWDAYDVIALAIMDIKAQTPAGFAVKARLCQQNYPQIFECPWRDADERYLRLLVDELAGAA